MNQRWRNQAFLKKEKTGFTLVELLVSIMVIITLSAVLLPNYNNFRSQFALLRSAHKLSQDLRRAQEMASSAKETMGTVPPFYGVYLQAGTDYYTFHFGEHALFKTIYLEDKIYIKEISPSFFDFLWIRFEGPNPTTSFFPDGELATITLAIEDSPEITKRVIVNKAGLIYAE